MDEPGEQAPRAASAAPAWCACPAPGAPAAPSRQRRFAAALIFGGLAALSATPASAQAVRKPVQSMLEIRQQDVVVQKYDLSCGAAALATILQFQHNDPVTEREITRGLIRRPEYIANPALVRIRQGFSLLDLKRYVATRGYRGIGYGALTFADLPSLAPAIVPINTNGYNHFVVFRGALGNKVLLADPAFGNRTMSRARFEEAWLDIRALGHVAFIVTEGGDKASPPGRLAARPDLFLAPSAAAVRQALPLRASVGSSSPSLPPG